MKVYCVSFPPDSAAPKDYPVTSGVLRPTRSEAEAEVQRHPGSSIEELEVDDYGDDARDYYRIWPAQFPKAPFPVAIDNLMARYAGDDPVKRAEVLEAAARVLRGQR